MSVLGIATNVLSQISSYAAQNKPNQLKQGFQQLGQDLQSGNLSQAQSDFASLQRLLPGGQQSSAIASTSATQSTSPLATAVAQLAQDLQSGNLTAAQSDITTVQQDVQQTGQQQGAGQAHHHHHHAGSGQSSDQQNAISTLFGELGQSLQSGNLSAAQQAYSSIQQDFQLFGAGASSSSSSNASSSNLNLSA
jgi:outer membrane protein assembly factor BamD (BamD/ComL family)